MNLSFFFSIKKYQLFAYVFNQRWRLLIKNIIFSFLIKKYIYDTEKCIQNVFFVCVENYLEIFHASILTSERIKIHQLTKKNKKKIYKGIYCTLRHKAIKLYSSLPVIFKYINNLSNYKCFLILPPTIF
jgi:hypothetical protein